MKSNVEALRPNCYQEHKEGYIGRVASLVPNIPKEILGQWFYDHFDCVMQRYSWLNISTIIFKLEIWDKEKIINNVKPWNEAAVESWAKQIISDSESTNNGLVLFMIKNKTWPVPPIVIDNEYDLKMPNGDEIARYELIEGHHRYAYFKGLYMSATSGLLNEHKLWLLKAV